MQAVRNAIPAGPDAEPGETLAYDRWLIGAVMLMCAFGLIMVASASIEISTRYMGDPMHYFWRQFAAAGIGIGGALVMIRIPLRMLEKLSAFALIASILLLALVLVPGLGRMVNGSMRWIDFGAFGLQASEPVKLLMLIYVAGYLVRHQSQVRSEFIGFIKPIGLMTIISGLLLLEPDYGSTVVIFGTTLGMLFLGGVPLLRFTAWGLVAVSALMSLAVLAPYRMQRLMTFMDPWADPFNSGFQLTQALIAFGRGEMFGVGLGSSVQKLFYLPEVHTDFIYAVVGEELGLAGSVAVILGFTFIVWRILRIGAQAESRNEFFAAYAAYGVAFLIGIQAFINIGVNMGVLPTKGLTLPLLSYGNNSMIITWLALGLVLRVSYETGGIAKIRRGGGARE
ncbi:MAG: putative lipid II flippase FtsW [Gammaproteobacteria bacterium]|nr:putative lipid II flippase FtsW [Gammaproteobacteria bacterium]